MINYTCNGCRKERQTYSRIMTLTGVPGMGLGEPSVDLHFHNEMCLFVYLNQSLTPYQRGRVQKIEEELTRDRHR